MYVYICVYISNIYINLTRNNENNTKKNEIGRWWQPGAAAGCVIAAVVNLGQLKHTSLWADLSVPIVHRFSNRSYLRPPAAIQKSKKYEIITIIRYIYIYLCTYC